MFDDIRRLPGDTCWDDDDIWDQDQWLEYEECDHHAHVNAAWRHHYDTDHCTHVDAYEWDSIPF